MTREEKVILERIISCLETFPQFTDNYIGVQTTAKDVASLTALISPDLHPYFPAKPPPGKKKQTKKHNTQQIPPQNLKHPLKFGSWWDAAFSSPFCIQIDGDQSESIHKFSPRFSAASLQSPRASFFSNYRRCHFQTTKWHASPYPLKRDLSTVPHFVLHGLTEGLPSKLQELTTFNALTSKNLESSAHGSYYQVMLTVGLLFARAPHDLWSSIAYFLLIRLHWFFCKSLSFL